MIRRTAAVLLTRHGLIHLVGFVSPWRIATLEGVAYLSTCHWDRAFEPLRQRGRGA
jgi:hypothetical protein